MKVSLKAGTKAEMTADMKVDMKALSTLGEHVDLKATVQWVLLKEL